jgi:hypothetical protein
LHTQVNADAATGAANAPKVRSSENVLQDEDEVSAPPPTRPFLEVQQAFDTLMESLDNPEAFAAGEKKTATTTQRAKTLGEVRRHIRTARHTHKTRDIHEEGKASGEKKTAITTQRATNPGRGAKTYTDRMTHTQNKGHTRGGQGGEREQSSHHKTTRANAGRGEGSGKGTGEKKPSTTTQRSGRCGELRAANPPRR